MRVDRDSRRADPVAVQDMATGTLGPISDQAIPAAKLNTRARWIALRTFRQAPNVVGATKAGEPIYEMRSVRLVLKDNAAHFSRLVSCSKCGREVLGPAVMGPADLDHPVNAVICRSCVRAASLSPFLVDQAEVVADEPASPPAVETEPERHEPERSDDGRMAALEQRVAELANALDGQRSSMDAAIEDRAQVMQRELAALAAGAQELARAQEQVGRTLAGTVERMDRIAAKAEPAEAIERRIQAVIARLLPRDDPEAAAIRAGLIAKVDALQAAMEAGMREVDGIVGMEAARAASSAAASDAARELGAVVERLDQRLAGLEAEQATVGLAVETSRGELLAHGAQTAEAGAALTRVAAENEDLRRAQADLGRTLESVVARVRGLEGVVETEVARAKSEAVARVQSAADLARVEEHLGRRLDEVAQASGALEVSQREIHIAIDRAHDELAAADERLRQRLEGLAESVARAREVDRLALAATGDQLRADVAGVPVLVESMRQEFQADLAEALLDARMAIAELDRDDGARIETLEKAVAERGVVIADLHDHHAALDAGLGYLRSELSSVASSWRELVEAHDEIRDQVGRLIEAQVAASVQGRRRGMARKAGEPAGQLAGVVQGLVQEQRRLIAQVADLERAAETVTTAAARATAGASSFGPVRSDVKALQEQVEAQGDALDALAKSLDALRRRIAGPAPSGGQRAASTTK